MEWEYHVWIKPHKLTFIPATVQQARLHQTQNQDKPLQKAPESTQTLLPHIPARIQALVHLHPMFQFWLKGPGTLPRFAWIRMTLVTAFQLPCTIPLRRQHRAANGAHVSLGETTCGLVDEYLQGTYQLCWNKLNIRLETGPWVYLAGMSVSLFSMFVPSVVRLCLFLALKVGEMWPSQSPSFGGPTTC